MTITIFLNREHSSVHIINPTEEFVKESRKFPHIIKEVVETVTPNYHSFKVSHN